MNLPSRKFLEERMTFDQLFKYSEPKRVKRSLTVRGPPMEIDANSDAIYHTFNFKSFPSTTGLRHHGYIKFLRPRNQDPNKVALQHVPCVVDCTCFGPETPVLMSNGVYKKICEIGPGDFVYTHKGRIRRVLGNVARIPRTDEKVYEIKVAGFPDKVMVTENHPFYALRGNTTCRCGCGLPLTSTLFERFNPARVLRLKYRQGHAPGPSRIRNETIAAALADRGQGMATAAISSKYGISKSSVENVCNGSLKPYTPLPDDADFQWTAIKNFRKREWFLAPWLEEGGADKLNPSLARFLGYYAAEGCLTARSDVSLCFHLDEVNTLGKDCTQIAESLHAQSFGFRTPQRWRGKQGGIWRMLRHDGLQRSRPQKCFSLHFHITPEFRALIEDAVGCGSRNKRMSEWLMRMDNATLKEFLTGLFLGDGHTNKFGHFRWTSTSTALVWNVSTVLRRLKVDHVITNCGDSTAVDVNRGDSARQVHEWLAPYLRTEAKSRKCPKVNSDEYDRPEGSLKVLRSIKEIPYTGQVWDLCVDEDHSFIAAGVAVANCPDYKYRFSWVNKQKGSSQVGPGSLNKAWNMAPKITNPSGIPGLCVAEGERVATKRGLLPIECVTTGDEVWTLDGWHRVLAAACTGVKHVVSVCLASGRTLRVTPEHPVLAFSEASGFEWISAADLDGTHHLCIAYPDDINHQYGALSVPEFTSSNKAIHYPGSVVRMDETFAELTGYMVAEGSPGLFAGQDQRLVSDFTEKWRKVFGTRSTRPRVDGCWIGNHGTRLLAATGFVFGSYSKIVPEWIMRANRGVIVAFLRGAYAGDGNFRNRHSTYASVSQVLARNMHYLLSSIGVNASLNCYKSGVNKCDTWVVRTSSGEETSKLFSILRPIRGYSSPVRPGGKPAISNYFIVNPMRLFERVVEKCIPVCASDEVVLVREAVRSIPDCSEIGIDAVALELAKQGNLKKIRMRAGGKPHNAAKLRDLYEAVRAYRAKKIVKGLNLPVAEAPWRVHRKKLKEGIEKLKDILSPAYEALKNIAREDLSFECVKSVTPSEIVRVHDLTVDGAEHFSASGVILHNCKHLLAARDYIYGLMAKFPEGEPDTAEKLNALVRYSNKRWADFPGAMAAARARDAKFAAALRRERMGLKPENDPVNEITPEPDLPLPPKLPSTPIKGPILPRAGKPQLPPQSYAASVPPPSARGRALPAGPKEKPEAGSGKYAQQAKKAGVPTAAELKHIKTIGDSLVSAQSIVNELLLECSAPGRAI